MAQQEQRSGQLVDRAFAFLRAAWLQAVILIAIAALTALDQLFKALAVYWLKGNPPHVLIDGVFELHYSENPGAAFGILQDHRWLFISVTILVMAFMLVLLMSGKFRRYPLMNISGVLIVAGGVGNLIDRIANGYVVDFLYFRLINFPIFNFADCCVVVGAVLLLIFFFFFYEEKPKSQQEEPAPADSLPATDEGAAEQAPQEEETPHGGEELDRSAGKDGGED